MRRKVAGVTVDERLAVEHRAIHGMDADVGVVERQFYHRGLLRAGEDDPCRRRGNRYRARHPIHEEAGDNDSASQDTPPPRNGEHLRQAGDAQACGNCHAERAEHCETR